MDANEAEVDRAEPLSQKESDEGEIKGTKKKKLSSKKKKVIIVVVIVAIALAVVLWGATPEDYLSVEDVVEKSDSYLGKEVEVKGEVGNWTANKNFTLLDDNDPEISIYVIHGGAMPEGFGEGKFVVVKGKLEQGENGLTLSSTKIQVGCPSKY